MDLFCSLPLGVFEMQNSLALQTHTSASPKTLFSEIMIQMSFYAIHRGRVPGIYKTWGETQKHVNSFSGAVFKKFKTRKEAEEFMKVGYSASTNKISTQSSQRPVFSSPKESQETFIFTDGSYSSKTHRSGLGVAFENHEELNVRQRLPDRTTNQEAELRAISVALEVISTNKQLFRNDCVIWTDSDYSCKCVSSYIIRWEQNGWRTSTGNPVKHSDTVRKIHSALTREQNVKLRHIKEVGLKSHQSLASLQEKNILTLRVWKGNNVADELASNDAVNE